MEAIREYLNNLFMSLPETPEVLRAKAELLEMMEDKYEEMLQQGKTEAEAVGIVISEFGNLEELAEELGIDIYMKKNAQTVEPNEKEAGTGSGNTDTSAAQNSKTVYCWGFDEARDYITYAWRHATYIGVAVFLCICAPYVSCVMDGAASAGYLSGMISDMIGTGGLFLLVAVAVALFCGASGLSKRYGKLPRYCILLDDKAGRLVKQKQAKHAQTRLTMRIVGISLCILSVVPPSINFFSNLFLREIIDTSILPIAGAGVLLLVMSSSVGNRYKDLEKAVKNAGKVQGKTYQGEVWESAPPKGMPVSVMLILVFAGFLVTGGATLGGLLFWSAGDAEYEETNTSNTYDFRQISTLAVELDACGLQIRKSEDGTDDQIRVEYQGDSGQKPTVTCSNGTLRIQEKRGRFRWFPFVDLGFLNKSQRNRTVTVWMPESLKEMEIQIEADAGEVTCSDLFLTNLTMNVDAGNAIVDGCTVTGKASMNVDAGNIELKNATIGVLEGEVDAGNVSCYLTEGTLEGYSMDLDVDLGEININGEEKGTSYKQTASLPQESGTQPSRIQLEVDMGDINIDTPVR